MAQKISQLTTAGTLTGPEQIEVSQLSTSVTITATTLSALASDNSYNDSGSGFLTAGFAVGDQINVVGFTGSTANNIYSAKITALTAGKMTIGGTDGDAIVDDAAGESVTITKWTSGRASLTDIGATISGSFATETYVDNAVATAFTQDSAKPEVAYASTSALPANTYSNGASGVGATLTGTANGPLTIDGVVQTATGLRYLVAGEATDSHNGWFTLTQLGVVAVSPYILTRDPLSDQAAEIGPGYLTPVRAPSGLTAGANDGKVFISIAPSPFVVGTSSLTFSYIGSVTTPGGSDKQSQFNDGGVLAGDSTYKFDKTTKVLSAKFLNIGTGSTFNANSISGDDKHLFNVTNDPSIDAGVGSAGNQLLRVNSYGTLGYGGDIHFCRYRGTEASPTAVQNGDTFMSFGMRGWDSSAALSQSAASWTAVATENWTGSAHGIKFVWQVTANGSTSRANGMELASTGLSVTGDITATGKIKNTESIIIPCGDETTALTTGLKVTFRMPYAFTLSAVRGALVTAATGGTLFSFDVKEAGTTIFSTLPTFNASSKTTVGATTPAVISDANLADDAEITILVSAIGSTIAGAGLKVTLIGQKA